jgi:hypothetical protein
MISIVQCPRSLYRGRRQWTWHIRYNIHVVKMPVDSFVDTPGSLCPLSRMSKMDNLDDSGRCFQVKAARLGLS